MPATIFITTGYIGTKLMFWPERLTTLLKDINEWNLDESQRASILQDIETKLLGLTHKRYLSGDSSFVSESTITHVIEDCKKLKSKHIITFLDELEEGLSRLGVIKSEGYRSILSWDEVRKMADTGISFGAHTRCHILLNRASFSTMKNEIIGSKKDIESKLNSEVTAFAYPNGNCNDEVVKIVGDAGFKVAFTTKYGINIEGTPQLKDKRIRVDDSFSAGLSGEFSRCLFEFNTWRHCFK
jgi:hypothetical protein